MKSAVARFSSVSVSLPRIESPAMKNRSARRSDWRIERSEERRVGKSVDHCVTGVQTCALPIYEVGGRAVLLRIGESSAHRVAGDEEQIGAQVRLADREIGRASCRKECRSLCDWSSDVCSSDL